jgi:hypothetical protein
MGTTASITRPTGMARTASDCPAATAAFAAAKSKAERPKLCRATLRAFHVGETELICVRDPMMPRERP